MANGLICQETLTSTPKYKIKTGNHQTYTRSNYVNKTSSSPPDYLTSQLAGHVTPPACLTGQAPPPARLTCKNPPPAYPAHKSFAPPPYNQITSNTYSNISSIDLMCHESATCTPAKPAGQPAPARGRPAGYLDMNFQHPPVKADCDRILLKDNRVLQNLLKSEDR